MVALKQKHLRQGFLALGIVLISLGVFLFTIGPGVASYLLNRVRGGPTEKIARRTDTPSVDLHADTLLWRRDIRDRHRAGGVDLPRLRDGGAGIQVFSIVNHVPLIPDMETNHEWIDGSAVLSILLRRPSETWSSPLARVQDQAAYLREIAAAVPGEFVVIQDAKGWKEWEQERARNRALVGGILAVEGVYLDPPELKGLDQLFQAGVRMFGLTHFLDHSFAGSRHGARKGGLTSEGRAIVAEIERRGGIIDLAHSSKAAFRDVLGMVREPVVVSHTGVAGVCPGTRNLTDDELAALKHNGALIGVGFWDLAICSKDLSGFVKTVRYLADHVGIDHIALGSDWDGTVATPIDASGIAHLEVALEQAGFDQGAIRKIIGENALLFFKQRFFKQRFEKQ